VLLGAMFKHHGHVAPAEIPSKRAWTYRHVLWLGHAHGIPIEMPATHPYNPLPHLRLALSTTHDGAISRHVAETIFRDVWRGGAEAGDASGLAALASQLAPVRDGRSEDAKAALRANTDEAIARGAFGVPTCVLDDRVFWGFDGLAMLRAAAQQDPWFDGPHWATADQRPGPSRNIS
jgi:2-hydroxychromene-2-carboxylate isomerase